MDNFMYFVTQNFWPLLLILALLFTKGQRIAGLTLILVMSIWGLVPWVFITVTVLACIWEIFKWSESDKFNLPKAQPPKKPEPLLRSTRRDPDYD